MSGFLLSLVLALLCSTGGKDQLLVAQLSSSFRKSRPVLAVGWFAAALTSGLAALAGSWLAPLMPGGGKAILVAIALAFAAVELAWRSIRKPAPKEPTRSVAAMLIVLLAHQLGDATRFVIFALAVWSANPALVATGGILGSGAAMSLGWAMGRELGASAALRVVRPLTAAVLAVCAAVIAILTLGLI